MSKFLVQFQTTSASNHVYTHVELTELNPFAFIAEKQQLYHSKEYQSRKVALLSYQDVSLEYDQYMMGQQDH